MAAKRNTGGRPKLPKTKQRLAVVAVRFTADERKRIQRQAEAEGLSAGVWLRHIALLALGP